MNGTRIRINVLRINDLRSTLTSIRFIELYIHHTEYVSETQGLPSSEIKIMLLIIGRRAGVFVRNTLRPSVLGLTERHSYLTCSCSFYRSTIASTSSGRLDVPKDQDGIAPDDQCEWNRPDDKFALGLSRFAAATRAPARGGSFPGSACGVALAVAVTGTHIPLTTRWNQGGAPMSGKRTNSRSMVPAHPTRPSASTKSAVL